jgi:putative ABC transport system permease protein
VNAWARLRLHLDALLHRRKREEDFARELASDLALEAEEQESQGLSREEASYAARRAFGNTALVSEDVRDAWGFVRIEGLARDFRYAARSLRKSPGFATVAILTLALGIGANTAIFSVINALILQPLPFSDSQSLVRIYSTQNGEFITGYGNPGGPSLVDVKDFADASHTIQQAVAYDTWRKNVSYADSPSGPQEMGVALVPPEYFEVLRIQPILGRVFTSAETLAGDHVALISASVWKTHFGGTPDVLSHTIRINEESYAIIGVVPEIIPLWMEPRRIDAWTPEAFLDSRQENARGSRGFATLARLRPGVSLEQAQTELSGIAARLAAAYPVDAGVGVAVWRLADSRAGSMRPMLALLAGSVSLILLIACSNLANLLIARNSARQRELAVRAALGSGRRGLVRQLLAETLLLSFVGGAVGLAVSRTGVAALTQITGAQMPQLASLGIDWRVLLFTFVVSVSASLIFGLAPALTGTQINLVDALKDGGRSGSAGRHRQSTRNFLVVAEIAMSLVLLVTAGLLLKSINRMQGQYLGVRQDHLLKGHMYIPRVQYKDPDAITHFCDDYGRLVRAIPGVVDATISAIFPPRDGWTQMFEIPGRPVANLQDVPSARFGVSDSHFVKTFGIPLLSGRDFNDSDTPTSRRVVLVNQALVRRYFPGEDPVGREIFIGPPPSSKIPTDDKVTDAVTATIVGVMGDFQNAGLGLPPDPQILVLYSQNPLVNVAFKDVIVRTATEPHSLVPVLLDRLHQLDAEIPLAEVATIDEVVEQQTGSQRFTTILLGLFALAGVTLAVIGIYGVISYLVAQRTPELAVRLALGASRNNIMWLVLRQGLSLALFGCVIGLAAAFATRQLLASVLFQISPLDPATYIAGTLLLLVIALAATAIPAARAMRIDLLHSLRQE